MNVLAQVLPHLLYAELINQSIN